MSFSEIRNSGQINFIFMVYAIYICMQTYTNNTLRLDCTYPVFLYEIETRFLSKNFFRSSFLDIYLYKYESQNRGNSPVKRKHKAKRKYIKITITFIVKFCGSIDVANVLISLALIFVKNISSTLRLHFEEVPLQP